MIVNSFILKTKVFLFFFPFMSCSIFKSSKMNDVNTHVIRLKPGQDLKQSIQDYVNQHQIEAGWMVTCAGSLTHFQIRTANQSTPLIDSGHFEIVSLTGTVSTNGSHLHISLSDSTGKTIGGHLLSSCLVYTTAEIVLQSSSSLIFKREKDGTTPWEELQIESKPKSN
jgi:predicted DNA-binding protein with PD1-like motif